MTNHFYEHKLVKLHYYKFGNGPKKMLCFHGFGMHGKQFKILEPELGDQYTFYGFDLFFHKDTKLVSQELSYIKQGITKTTLSEILLDFCDFEGIDKFSIIAYSMGTHYGSALVETFPERIDQIIFAAPAALRPGKIVTFFSCNPIGNKIAERLALSDKGLINFINLLKKTNIIDQKIHQILLQELGTPELRLNLYASLSFLKPLKLNKQQFIEQLNSYAINSLFIFGDKDHDYPESMSKKYASYINNGQFITIPANHDMINVEFSKTVLKHLR